MKNFSLIKRLQGFNLNQDVILCDGDDEYEIVNIYQDMVGGGKGHLVIDISRIADTFAELPTQTKVGARDGFKVHLKEKDANSVEDDWSDIPDKYRSSLRKRD